MPIPAYLTRGLVSNYSIIPDHCTLKLPKTSYFVNTEHMRLRFINEPFESKAMSDCIFSLDEYGNLVL